jgi:hypothetical protein
MNADKTLISAARCYHLRKLVLGHALSEVEGVALAEVSASICVPKRLAQTMPLLY